MPCVVVYSSTINSNSTKASTRKTTSTDASTAGQIAQSDSGKPARIAFAALTDAMIIGSTAGKSG